MVIGTVAILATVLGVVLCGAAPGWRRGWRRGLRSLGLNERGEGVVEGRGVRAFERRGELVIEVCVANRGRLLDVLEADDLLARAPWIPPLARARLGALAPLHGCWRVEVEDRTLRLRGQCASVRRPELLGFLVDLACDLAESVDSRERRHLVVA
jgi:hypothetical protein